MDQTFKGRRVLPAIFAEVEPPNSANTDPAKAFMKAGGTVTQWLAICESAAKHKPNQRKGGAAPRRLAQHSSHYS